METIKLKLNKKQLSALDEAIGYYHFYAKETLKTMVKEPKKYAIFGIGIVDAIKYQEDYVKTLKTVKNKINRIIN